MQKKDGQIAHRAILPRSRYAHEMLTNFGIRHAQDAVVDLLHQQSLSGSRAERPQQQGAQQLLWRNRRSPNGRIEAREPRRELREHVIGQPANRAQRVALNLEFAEPVVAAPA
jgi:hypothetical protein